MSNLSRAVHTIFALLVLVLPVIDATCAKAAPPPSQKLALSAAASAILDEIYSGDLRSAEQAARQLQQADLADPLGYLLEGEALWWNIWCTSAEFKFGMSYPRRRAKLASDQHYFELAARASSLAEKQIAQHETPEMYFYAGMADALLARIYGLRGETRNSARAGIHAREHLLRAVALDPDLADAYLGLGLYNYYADTLSSMARVLRFFMGIPGGNKQEGIQQLHRAIDEGVLAPTEARFYLVINLHNFDQKYEQALQLAEPLVEKYPSNPLFQLIRGDLYAKLGRRLLAADCYRAAAKLTVNDPDCNAHIQELVSASLSSLSQRP